MNDKEINDFVSKGHILCRVIFEMAGNPKEHVEKTLKQYIDSVKEDTSYIFMNEYTAPCEETDGVWSTFHEAEMLVDGFEKLNVMCFNLGPASIEILKPELFSITEKKMTDWYNDLLSKLHEIGISVKNLNGENELLKVNLNRAIKNCVILTLTEPKTAEEVSERVGIDKDHLLLFLDAMMKDKSLVKDGDKYRKSS